MTEDHGARQQENENSIYDHLALFCKKLRQFTLQKKCRRVKKKNKTKQNKKRDFDSCFKFQPIRKGMAQSQKKKWCQLNIKYSHSCLLINSKFFSVSISGKAYHIYVFCVIYRQWTVTELYKLKHLFNWNTELREVCFECCLVNTFGAIWINLFVFHMFGFCLLLRA